MRFENLRPALLVAQLYTGLCVARNYMLYQLQQRRLVMCNQRCCTRMYTKMCDSVHIGVCVLKALLSR
jgi:hypothetical protein